MASDLLRVIARIGGDEAAAFIARQASHADKAVLDEALWHLEHMPYSGAVGRGFFDAFRWTDPARRARVLGMIARTRDRRFVDLLAGYVEEQASKMTPGEAAQIGQVLGELAGEASVERWGEWLKADGPVPQEHRGTPRAAGRGGAGSVGDPRRPRRARCWPRLWTCAEPEAQQWILGALGPARAQFGSAL